MRYTFQKDVRGRSNTWKKLQKGLATLLAKTLHANHRQQQHSQFSLHGIAGRKYLNKNERRAFLESAKKLPIDEWLFCAVLAWSGARISETLAITPAAIDIDSGLLSLETLKRRRRGIVRQVPLPPRILHKIDKHFGIRSSQRNLTCSTNRLWPWSRSTGWRCVKKAMKAAHVFGTAAMPKGLRHGFAVAAFATTPPHLVQRWLGHASLRTTAIYGDVSGEEEQLYARRLWSNS